MDRPLQIAGFKEHKFHIDGLEINYVKSPRRRIPLLLIPGQTMPWESYTKVLPGLARDFEVYAVDVRGHGKSGWTPGEYTFNNMGQDFAALLEREIGRPAFVSGNSSGGVIAVWLAANAPEWVRGVIPEDPPLFSCEWPRLRDDCYAYGLFKLCSETLSVEKGRDLSAFFARFILPVEGKVKLTTMPRSLSLFVSLLLKGYQALRHQGPIDMPFLPLDARLFIRGLSEYDPGFSAAFLDGSPGVDFDHAETLSRVTCPMLLLQAPWFRHKTLGLVGAMDDDDVARVHALVKDLRFLKVDTGHVIHIHRPDIFVSEIVRFAEEVEKGSLQ